MLVLYYSNFAAHQHLFLALIQRPVQVDWTKEVKLGVVSLNAGVAAPLALQELLPNAHIQVGVFPWFERYKVDLSFYLSIHDYQSI